MALRRSGLSCSAAAGVRRAAGLPHSSWTLRARRQPQAGLLAGVQLALPRACTRATVRHGSRPAFLPFVLGDGAVLMRRLRLQAQRGDPLPRLGKWQLRSTSPCLRLLPGLAAEMTSAFSNAPGARKSRSGLHA